MKYLSASIIALGLAATFFLAPQPFVSATAAASESVPQTDQAGSALQQGRKLMKRGQTAEALGHLQTALTLYTDSKNARGIGAAHNELGDLYLRQGQHKVALDHFQKAYQALSGAVVQEQQAGAAAGGAAAAAAAGSRRRAPGTRRRTPVAARALPCGSRGG